MPKRTDEHDPETLGTIADGDEIPPSEEEVSQEPGIEDEEN